MSAAPSSAPAPFSWPPSQYWDDVNGPWSSFALRVGSQQQIARVLVSTAGQATWVVLPDGCKAPICAPSLRGGTFNINESQTWNGTGNYSLGIELNLNYSYVGAYGLDTVALGFSSSNGGPPLDSQVVAGIETNSYYMGMFGLGPQPTNFTNFSEPHPSFLSTLKSKNLIPSLSWGYTAGAHYRLKGVYGSLTLGGRDRSRFIHNDVSFHMAPDLSRDLVVVLHSIMSKDSTGLTESLLPYPILIFIDSTVPYIYLPLEACKRFEQIFGLIWDPLMNMYTVDDKLHRSLTVRNPNFTFTLGDSEVGPTVDIVLPYASFDLLASYPLVPNNTRYFPLLRAENATQYTLGRAFLQEAYLVTNYEYSNFSLFQTKFEDGLEKDIVSNPARSSTNIPISPSEKQVHRGNRALAIGVGLGTLVIVVLSVLIIAFFTRKRRFALREKRITGVVQPFAPTDDFNSPSTITVQEVDSNSLCVYKEMTDTGIFELPHTPCVSELTGSLTTLVPNLSHMSIRPGQLAENPVTNPFKKRRFAMCISTGSMIDKDSPANNKNGWDDKGKPPAPDLNRALPPTPNSGDGRFSWIKRNTVLAKPSDLQGTAASPVLDLDRALPPIPRLKSMRFLWIMKKMALARQSNSQEIASSDVDSVPWYSEKNFF